MPRTKSRYNYNKSECSSGKLHREESLQPECEKEQRKEKEKDFFEPSHLWVLIKYDARRSSINSLSTVDPPSSPPSTFYHTITTCLTKISLEKLHHPSSCWTMMANHSLLHQERRPYLLLFSFIQSQVGMGVLSFFSSVSINKVL